MKEILNKLFKREKVQFLGILGEQNKANIHQFDEVVIGAFEPEWTEKKPDEWRSFLSQNQYQTSACVAFTIAKMAQILYYLKTNRKIKFSPGWIYRKRSPQLEGMWIDNAVAIASGGLPTEELYPSENLTEVQINSLPDLPYIDGIAKEFSIPVDWIEVPIDFDTVASTIQTTKKGIMLWFSFGNREWFRKGIPEILNTGLPYRHSVTAVDAVVYEGEQYIVVEDSAEDKAPFGHRKLVNREFFNSRCFLARYPLSFKFDRTYFKPKYDGSIVSLQDCLKFEGVMPTNVPSTGYYGSITIQAVKDFQKKYNIQQTGNVGPITINQLKYIYG